MARIKIKAKSKNKKIDQQSTTTNDKTKENGKIYKFSPQVIGQKNEYATFASIKEKLSDELKWSYPKVTTSNYHLKKGRKWILIK